MKFYSERIFKVLSLAEKRDVIINNCNGLLEMAEEINMVDYTPRIEDIAHQCDKLPVFIGMVGKGDLPEVNHKYQEYYKETARINDFFCEIYKSLEKERELEDSESPDSSLEDGIPAAKVVNQNNIEHVFISEYDNSWPSHVVKPVPIHGLRCLFFNPQEHVGIPRVSDYNPMNNPAITQCDPSVYKITK